MTPEEMELLQPVNVSIGMMLESTSRRLMEHGQAHYRTTYKTLRVFGHEPTEPQSCWSDERFRIYATPTASPQFRFRDRSWQ